MDSNNDSIVPAGGVEPTTVDMSTDTPEAVEQKKRWAMWLDKAQRCTTLKRELIPDWALNIDYRRAKPFQEDSDNDRVQVTVDWSATKAKQSQLFSQVPEVRLTEKRKKFASVAPMFSHKVNDTLGEARVGVAMDENLPDCINAAGFACTLVAFESRTIDKIIPFGDASVQAALKAEGKEVKMVNVPYVSDARFLISRVSPGDALWEVSFTGSDFDDSPWTGRKGRKSWDDARIAWSKLTAEDKAKVVGEDSRSDQDMLTGAEDRSKRKNPEVVEYTEIFYWRYLFHPDEPFFKAIHHLVFVRGKDEPVVDEPWKGQRVIEGVLYGPQKFPLRYLTLTYLSDESIPPSDSAMGRPQVNELNRSRSQVIKNRESSTPWRWFNVNLVDPQVQTALMRGTWQGAVPMNGDGNRAMGEIARASYPNEDFHFDDIAKQDLRETWQVEDAVGNGPAIRSATEANNRQTNFQTRIGYERARCARHFVGIAEVTAGLYALFGKFEQEDLQAMQAVGIKPEQLSSCYAFNVRADSTLLLDAQQRTDRLMNVLNMTAKSGYIDVGPIIAEIVELNGLDPSVVMKTPQGKGPEPLNASLRLSGAADLNDPLVIGMLLHSGQMPTPAEMNEAKLFLASLAQQPTPPEPPSPAGEAGPEGQPPAGGPPQGAKPPEAAGQPGAPASGGRVVQPAAPYSAHPEWNTASRIEKRAEDGK